MDYVQFLGLLVGLRFVKLYIFGEKIVYDPDRKVKDSASNMCVTLLMSWFSYVLLKYNLPIIIELIKKHL